MRITNGEDIAGQQSFTQPTWEVTHRKIIETLVALSLDLCLMGPNTRTVYLLDVVMRRIDSVLVQSVVIVLTFEDL